MKNKAKPRASKLDTKQYIYLRVGEELKETIREVAKERGWNMTLWIREELIKAVAHARDNHG